MTFLGQIASIKLVLRGGSRTLGTLQLLVMIFLETALVKAQR
jgi:hypothetical protein